MEGSAKCRRMSTAFVYVPLYMVWYRSLSQSNFLGIRSHYPQNSTGVVFCRRLAVGLVPPKTLTVGYLHRASGVWIRLLGPAVVTFVYQNPTRSFYTKSNYSTTLQNTPILHRLTLKITFFEKFTMSTLISVLSTYNNNKKYLTRYCLVHIYIYLNMIIQTMQNCISVKFHS